MDLAARFGSRTPNSRRGTFPTTVTASAKVNSLTSGADGESTFVFPEESGAFACGTCGTGTQSANFCGLTFGADGGSMLLSTAFGTLDEVVGVVEATVGEGATVILGASVVDGASVALGASVLAGASVTLGASVVEVLVVVEVDVVEVGMGNELESPYWNKRTPAAQRCSYLPIGYSPELSSLYIVACSAFT